jgi:hypothetical protein
MHFFVKSFELGLTTDELLPVTLDSPLVIVLSFTFIFMIFKAARHAVWPEKVATRQ